MRKILQRAVRWYCKPLVRLGEWKIRRFPDVRRTWIRRRARELWAAGSGVDWMMYGAETQAIDEWRIAQHRSWLGLRHRVNAAVDYAGIAGIIAWLTWPLLALAGWVISHVTIGWR